jgi:hypothetical protein
MSASAREAARIAALETRVTELDAKYWELRQAMDALVYASKSLPKHGKAT